MVVEYGRSCYSSAWRLFADRPDQLVRGRYYFAPDNAPHFPSVHRLGSRNWNDQEYVTEQTLGEDLLYPQKWNAGQPPAAPPNVISIGPLREFANGSQSAAAVAVRTLIDGFIPDCYPLDERLPIWREISAYARCQVQRLWAYVICLLYEQDGAGIVALFTDWIGDQAVVTFHDRTVLFPACCTVIAEDWSAIAWEGTTYYEQYALQGLYSLAGPINFGGLSTLPLWYQAATRGLDFLTADGHVVGKPIFFAGHSYGAAAATIAAARLRLVGTTPFIRYLTFGSPKPGDDRLTDLIQRCQGYSLRNAGDWVTIVPLDELQIWPFLTIYPPGILRALERWSATPNSYVQHEDGFLEPRGQQTLTTETIAHILSFAFAGEPLEILNAHTLAEYRRRIDVRCQGALWPVSDAIYQECEGCSPPPLLPNGWLDLGGHPLPVAPAGSIELGGEVPLYAVDCDHAREFLYNTAAPIGLFFPTGVTWFRCAVPNGLPHYMIVTSDGVNLIAGNGFRGPDCTHLTGLGVYIVLTSFCRDAPAATDCTGISHSV